MTWAIYALRSENLETAITIFLLASPWYLAGTLLGRRIWRAAGGRG